MSQTEHELIVPALGESVTEAVVAKWLKQVGDAVEADEAVVELETDKANIEVAAPVAGVLGSIDVQADGEVAIGARLGVISEATPVSVAATATAAAPVLTATPATPVPTPAPTPVLPVADLIAIVVPPLGESVTEAIIANWSKQAGEAVEADELLVELETEKVNVEVRAPKAGTLSEIVAASGSTVEIGSVIARIAPGAAGMSAAASAPAPTKAAAKAATKAAAKAGPAATKLAAESGIDLNTVTPTGAKGHVTKGDVMGAQAAPAAPTPPVAPAMSVPAMAAPAGPVVARDGEEVVPMSRLRRAIASRLKEAQNTAAMLTTFNEIDMSAVFELRSQYKAAFEKRHGTKLGFMGFFVKAATAALKEFPAVNAEIRGDSIVFKNYYDIGIAVGTPQGLVVPVLRGADALPLHAIEAKVAEFGTKARDGKLSPSELSGGTFTVTNGGIFGSLLSTPILNPPQSGILGMHKIQQRPIVDADGVIKAAPMMYVAHSYDHRIIDGREAVLFLSRIKELIEDPARLVLDA